MTGSSGLAWLHRQRSTLGSVTRVLLSQPGSQKPPLKNIVATHPLELVHLDHPCLEPGKGLEENVLVVTDHFTRYAQAYVTRTQTTQMTAKTLWDKFIVHHGLPERILTDQGWNFESQLVPDLCELMGMWEVQTSLYHPQTNGQHERFNSTPINMLGTLPKEKKSDWKNHIGTLVHVYNCTWIQLQGSAPAFSGLGGNLVFPLMSHLVWLHAQSQSQTCPSVFRKSGSTPSGLRKRLRHFRPKKHNNTNESMISKVGQQPWKSGTWF